MTKIKNNFYNKREVFYFILPESKKNINLNHTSLCTYSENTGDLTII